MMPFKLEHSNKFGDIKINLARDVSAEEMMDLCQFADHILSSGGEEESAEKQYGPMPVAEELQSRLGQKPTANINMGTYSEPDDGVRLKMLHMIDTNRIAAFKILNEATGISMSGCKDIIYGNYPCPILTVETAGVIIEQFKSINVFAKIVSAFDDAA